MPHRAVNVLLAAAGAPISDAIATTTFIGLAACSINVAVIETSARRILLAADLVRGVEVGPDDARFRHHTEHAALGAVLTGYIYSTASTYLPALLIIIGLVIVARVCGVMARRAVPGEVSEELASS